MGKAPFTHVTAMRLAFEKAACESSRGPTQSLVRHSLRRRRYKPGVVHHRKGWFVKR